MPGNATLLAVLGLVVFGCTTAVWFRRAGRVAIPDNRAVFLGLWGLAAVLGVASFFSSGAGWLSGVCGTLATLGGVGLLSLYALGKQGVGERPISVGDRIPVFAAVDGEGATFDSAALAGTPTLLKFFRGHW